MLDIVFALLGGERKGVTDGLEAASRTRLATSHTVCPDEIPAIHLLPLVISVDLLSRSSCSDTVALPFAGRWGKLRLKNGPTPSAPTIRKT